MGQYSKWLPQQLSQFISNSTNTIRTISNSSNNGPTSTSISTSNDNNNNNIYVSSNSHFYSSHIPSENISDIVYNFNDTKTVLSSTVYAASAATVTTTTTTTATNDAFPTHAFGSFAEKQIHNFSNSFAEKLSDAIQLALTSSNQRLNKVGSSTSNGIENDYNDDMSISSNYWMMLLIVLYFVVVLGGIFGNASLIITLYTQSSARLRNPLLVALCLADLMVTGVAAPLTIVTLILMSQKTITSPIVCRFIYFMQSVPVAASTISLLMLSLDRYATVKHPRLAQLRQRRFLPAFLAIVSWISAICVSIPILLGEESTRLPSVNATAKLNQTNALLEITTNTRLLSPENDLKSNVNFGLNGMGLGTNGFNETGPEAKTLCQPIFGPAQMPSIFLTIYTLFVFILPGIGVILNHLGVHQKLCALSLTARAAHGELPLPMPIMRRPTHMIIVTGMANAAAVRDEEDSTNDENNQQKDERRYMMDSTRLKATPRTPRSLRYGHSIRSHAHNTKNAAPSELPLPQTSTLRSRRRLANMLVAGSFVFIFCWSPHVICLIYTTLAAGESYSKTATNYSLLLGYTHSALNPILHWALNQNSLRQSSFLSRLTSVQRFMRTHFHERNHQPPPSSTNEAALGPFNPRYIKTRPQQYNAPPASSHYMY